MWLESYYERFLRPVGSEIGESEFNAETKIEEENRNDKEEY